MTIWPPENPANELCVLDPRRPPFIVERSRFGRARDIFTDGAALSAYPLPPQTRGRFDRDLPEICRKADVTGSRLRLQRFPHVIIEPDRYGCCHGRVASEAPCNTSASHAQVNGRRNHAGRYGAEQKADGISAIRICLTRTGILI